LSTRLSSRSCVSSPAGSAPSLSMCARSSTSKMKRPPEVS
jgi:hypothetical protein